MTWTGTFTYYGDLSDQLQMLRSLVADTDADDPLLYDEEYAPYLTGGSLDQADDYRSAALVADTLAVRFARQVQSLSAGGDSVVNDVSSSRAKFFRALAKQLRGMASGGSGAPFAGGISRSDVTSREADTDRVPPYFARSLPSAAAEYDR